jgi:hypothetical protein
LNCRVGAGSIGALVRRPPDLLLQRGRRLLAHFASSRHCSDASAVRAKPDVQLPPPIPPLLDPQRSLLKACANPSWSDRRGSSPSVSSTRPPALIQPNPKGLLAVHQCPSEKEADPRSTDARPHNEHQQSRRRPTEAFEGAASACMGRTARGLNDTGGSLARPS